MFRSISGSSHSSCVPLRDRTGFPSLQEIVDRLCNLNSFSILFQTCHTILCLACNSEHRCLGFSYISLSSMPVKTFFKAAHFILALAHLKPALYHLRTLVNRCLSSHEYSTISWFIVLAGPGYKVGSKVSSNFGSKHSLQITLPFMLALCVHSCQDRRIFGRSTLYIGYLVDPLSLEYLSVRAPLINLQLQHRLFC